MAWIDFVPQLYSTLLILLTQIPRVLARDRTPSFYTSRSILHLSGLSVADPGLESVKRNSSPRNLNRSRDSGKSDYENEENWISTENEHDQYEDDEEEEEEEEVKSRPQGIQKTTSMANFYYKKSRSSEEFLHILEKEKAKEKGIESEKSATGEILRD